MLSLTLENNSSRPLTRRRCLQIGTLGLGGLTLGDLIAAQASTIIPSVQDKAIVMLFLTGGASHIETFDPKMDAPSEYRSVTGELSTEIPGVTIGGTFPQTARLAHRMSIVRSFTHEESNHTRAVQLVARGANPTEAGMGAILARIRGSTHRQTGMPTHAYLGSPEVDKQFNKERLRLLEACGSGSLGSNCAPFRPGGDGKINLDMRLNIPQSRMDDRRALRTALRKLSDGIDDDSFESIDKFERQALRLILGNAQRAFDLSREDPRLIERYTTKQYSTGITAHRQSTVGVQMLLARRLCEAGCGFVTIHNPGWDMHGGDTQLDMQQGMRELGRPVDHAIATFLEDVHDRGLSDKILLVVTSEFGRTPKIKPNGGRDHWPRLSTLAFAGGDLQMGQVIGTSDRHAEAPSSNPVTLDQLFATIIHFLFDVPQLRLSRDLPRRIASVIESSKPIADLF